MPAMPKKWQAIDRFIKNHFVPQSRRASDSLLYDDAVYRCLEQVYCLHPDLPVARRMLVEAARVFPRDVSRQLKRAENVKAPFRARLPLWDLFQITLLKVSEDWEKDQEKIFVGEEPEKRPWYTPTTDVMLIRFSKFLACLTMKYPASIQMALALGSCLFNHLDRDIYEFWKEAAALSNVGDTEYWLDQAAKWHKQLACRFARAGRTCGGLLERGTPHLSEPDLVKETMAVFKPVGTNCLYKELRKIKQKSKSPTPLLDLLPTLTERQRQHALLCISCSGLERMVDEWNLKYPAPSPKYLEPLLSRLQVPCWNSQVKDPGSYDDPSNPLNDPFDLKVTPNDLEELRLMLVDTWQSMYRRLRANQFQQFRVCIDDQEQFRFPRGARLLPALTLPLRACCIRVLGLDAAGEVPLGVFYLPGEEVDEEGLRLDVVLESGATLTVTVTPGPAVGGKVTGRQGHLEFWEEEALVPKTAAWYEAAWTSALLSLELARITGDSGWEADIDARLTALARAAATAQGGTSVRALHERGIWWLSALWEPEPQTAAAGPEQHAFVLEEGEIILSCMWDAGILHVYWEADIPIPSEFWLRLLDPDTMALLAEFPLGTRLEGERTLTETDLGFSLSSQRWALAIALRDPTP